MATRFPSARNFSARKMTMGVFPVPPTVRLPTRATGGDAATAAESSWSTAQILSNGGEGAVKSAAATFDELARGAAHAIHFVGIFEEVNHFYTRVFGAFDLYGSAGFDEAGGDGGEIFHGWAEDGDFAEGGRFEDVVAAGIDERAADKHAVGQAVEGGKLTDGVEQEDGDVVRNGSLAVAGIGSVTGSGKGQFRAADEFAVGLFDEFGGGGETFGLAGGENEQSLRKIALHYTENKQGQRFFGGDDAAGDDERAAAVAGDFFLEPFGHGSGGWEFEVVFQVAADGDFFGRGTEGENAVGVLLGLHEEGGGLGERGFEERLEIETKNGEIGLPAGEGAIGDAAADEENGDVAAGCFAEEVGPDFGFEDDDEGGFYCVENAANGEGPVEREIDYGVGKGHTLFGEGVAGEGGGGDDEGALGLSIFQAAGESYAGEGFADRDSVNPDGAGMLGGEFFESRNGKAEALPEIGEIFAVAQALDEPIGRRQHGGQAH